MFNFKIENFFLLYRQHKQHTLYNKRNTLIVPFLKLKKKKNHSNNNDHTVYYRSRVYLPMNTMSKKCMTHYKILYY